MLPETLFRCAARNTPRVTNMWVRCLSQSRNVATQQAVRHASQQVEHPKSQHIQPASRIVKKPDEAPPAPPALSMGQQAMVTLNETGITRGERPVGQIFASSLLGGAYLSWGGAMFVTLGGGTVDAMSGMPGLHKVMSAAIFPLGLSSIVISGTDLLTSNMLYSTLPYISGDPRRTTEEKTLNLTRLLTVSTAGNLVASVGMAAATAHLFAGTAMGTFVAGLAAKKVAGSSLLIFAKACGANWLVNLAVFQATTATTTPAKMAALWLPITSFVALGLEHCVANFYLLPLGALCGADISLLDILHNLVPAVLGNFVGASFFVGYLQWKALRPPTPRK